MKLWLPITIRRTATAPNRLQPQVIHTVHNKQQHSWPHILYRLLYDIHIGTCVG